MLEMNDKCTRWRKRYKKVMGQQKPIPGGFAHKDISKRRNRPLKPQLNWCPCITLCVANSVFGEFKHTTGTTKEKWCIQTLKTTQYNTVWIMAEILFYFLLAHNSFFNLCQSTGERWADEREKKEVCGSRKALDVLDCRGIIQDKTRVVAKRNECKQ